MRKTSGVLLGLALGLGTGGWSPGLAQGNLPKLGQFEFYAITPSSSTVKPGQSLTLRIQSCPPESRQPPPADDELVPLPTLPGDDLVPLPKLCQGGPSVRASSVSATAGQVVQTSPTTLVYTAPAGQVKANPVTVTATYTKVNGTQAKVLLVAHVNVLDEVQVYEGAYSTTVKLANSSMQLSGKLTWTLKQSMMGIKTYQPSGTVKVQATSDKCSGSGTFPVNLGMLVVDKLTDSGALKTGTFLFEAAPQGELKLSCPKGGSVTESLAAITSCEDRSYENVSHLQGRCKDRLMSAQWDFRAVK